MGITIVKGDKILTLEINGAKIEYKRCSLPMFIALQKSHIADERTGEVDHAGVQGEILSKCVIGWDGVFDENDIPLSFDVEMLAYFPPDTQNKIASAICQHITTVNNNELTDEQKSVMERAIELGLPFDARSRSANT